jgi:hypothetical protein
MNNSEKMLLDKMDIYLKFINECKNKKYDKNLVLHKHHILPRGIYGETKDIVKLSVDDHINAHLLLAECFDYVSNEYNQNLRSARLLNKKSIKDFEILEKIKQSYIGENNPFYNKKHTEETKKIIADKAGNRTRGKTYKELYGDKYEEEKLKRKKGVKNAHKNMSDKEKTSRSKNISNSLIGKLTGSNNGQSKSIIVNGIYYGSIIEATKMLNISKYKLYKYYKIEKTNKK